MILLLACTSPSIPLGGAGSATAVLTGPCADRSHAAVVIHEVLPGNISGQVDVDGDTSDWLELRNLDARRADLAGWALEDDEDRWEIPARTLEPGEILTIFVSGKDGRAGHADSAELHTDFALGSVDTTLWLTAADGCIVDEARWDAAPADASYGRPEFALDQWGWFLEPTFGLANTTESRPGFTGRPSLSHAGGYLPAPILVSAEAAPGATLRYTRSGKTPTVDDPELTQPERIDPSEGPADGVQVLQVRAFDPELWPGPVATATFFGAGPLEAGLTVVSLVSDPDGLFSNERGIWAYGDDYEPGYPYFGANFWEHWERPLSLEVFTPDGARALGQDAGLRIHGGYSRAFDQRGLRLLARSAYGDDTFDHPFFPRETLDAFHTLVLHNGGDWCSTHLIDASSDLLLRDLAMQRYAGVDSAAWAPVMVYLNGDFWGMYQLRERMDEWWIADHHDADPDDLDQVELGWTHEPHWELEQGDWEAFYALNGYVARHDLATDAGWAGFAAQVDVLNLASLAALEAWYGNSDFWGNNIRMWRARDGGRWRWMIYDLGHGWPSVGYDQLGTSLTYVGPGMPLGAAFTNARFRELFAAALADYLNTSLAPSVAADRVRSMVDRVRPGMPAQLERWCGGASMDGWESAAAYAVDYASERGLVLRGQARDALGLGPDVALDLTADPPEGGGFQLTAVRVDGSFHGAYYAGVPMSVVATPSEGYRFEGWAEAPGVGEAMALTMRADVALTARFVAE